MKNIRIVAGIVLFNPELDRLNKNIDAVINQVDEVVLIDNGSNNINLIINNFKHNFKIKIIRNNENKGIAYALNQILKYSLENKFEWFLTLDQDSILKSNIIKKYIEYIDYENVSIITSNYIDLNIGKKNKNSKSVFQYVDFCITSGSMCNTRIIYQMKGFDEYMFIDYVDYDICATLIENGYKILKINDDGFYHEVGKSKYINFLFGKVIVYNHNAVRTYYIIRNSNYYLYKHRKSLNYLKWNFKIFKKKIIIIMFERDKIEKIKIIIRADKDFKQKRNEMKRNGL